MHGDDGFEAPIQDEAIRNAEHWLEENRHDLARAVLIHDGYFTWAGNRRDALLARVSDFHSRARRFLEVVLPYRHANDEGKKSWTRHLDQSV